MKVLTNKLVNSLIIALGFVFVIFVFAPLEIFYTNKADLWFQIDNIYYLILGISVVAFILIFTIAVVLKNKARYIYIRILTTLILTLYIQGNFLNFGYGILDGSEINWSGMILKGIINLIIWTFLVIFPFCIKKLKEENNFYKFTSVVTVFITTIELTTLIFLIINTTADKNYNVNQENKFKLSEKENIIVFMSDTFEATYMNTILEQYPEYKEKLKDFTYFDNCTGIAEQTLSSMPVILTNKCNKIENTIQSNINNCFSNTDVYEILKDNDYETEIYCEKILLPTIKNVYIDNLVQSNPTVPIENEIQITKKLYKYVAFRYFPHFMKSRFLVKSNEFDNIKQGTHIETNGEIYTLNDVKFNNELIKKEITSNLNKKAFKIYQLWGVHDPCNITPNLIEDISQEYNNFPKEQRKINQSLAQLNLLCNYIEELKKAGIYKNTNIIFLADHGQENKFYPILLVKEAEKNKDFKISSVPVSILEDFWPTILNMATNTKMYGRDFFDYTENEERIRTVYYYIYAEDFTSTQKHKAASITTYKNKGKADDLNSYYIVDEKKIKPEGILEEEYTFNNIINLKSNISEIKNAQIFGISKDYIDKNNSILNGCNASNNIEITFKRPETEENIKAFFKIGKVYGDSQILTFKIDNVRIYECELEGTSIEQIVIFEIPNQIWNKKDEITISINIPKSKFEDYQNKSYTVIEFNSCWFTNKL